MEPVKKYIGPRAVEYVVVTGDKSFLGTDILKVQYEGGATEVMTQLVYDLVSTESPADFNSVRDTQFKALRAKLYPLLGAYIGSMEAENAVQKLEFVQQSLIFLAEYSVKQRDIDKVFNDMTADIKGAFEDIGQSIDGNYDRVTNFLWTGDDKKFIPGVHPVSDITFLETKKFLEKINDTNK
jgi:hypothetical protein